MTVPMTVRTPVPTTMRRGYLLAEALCALALAGLLAAAAATALVQAQRAMRAAETRERADRASFEALAVLQSALESGRVLAVRGDTAVDVDLALVVAPVCGIESRAVIVPPPATLTDPPLTAALQAPGADDIAAFRLLGGTLWSALVVDSVQERTTGACGVAEAWVNPGDATGARWRLALRDTVPSTLTLGDEVRVGRTGRFALYHAGNGEWMLGWRRCAPITFVCGVVQPVAGPLRTPAAGGLRIVAATNPTRWELEARAAGSNRVERATVYKDGAP